MASTSSAASPNCSDGPLVLSLDGNFHCLPMNYRLTEETDISGSYNDPFKVVFRIS